MASLIAFILAYFTISYTRFMLEEKGAVGEMKVSSLPVTLSEAKGLRVEILRFAQNDNHSIFGASAS